MKKIKPVRGIGPAVVSVTVAGVPGALGALRSVLKFEETPNDDAMQQALLAMDANWTNFAVGEQVEK